MGSLQLLPAASAITLVFLCAAPTSAADPITARAGAARINVNKPNGPTPMVQRGLILPVNLIDFYAQPWIERPVGTDNLHMTMTLGALWGFAPELHADFQITPLFVPEFTTGTARFAIGRRFVNTRPIDVGVNFATLLDPSAPKFIGYVQPGIAAIFRPTNLPRIDTGVQLPIYTTKDLHFGVRVPVNVYFQITDRIHFGSTTALSIADLRDPRTASIPLGLTAGYSAGPRAEFRSLHPLRLVDQLLLPRKRRSGYAFLRRRHHRRRGHQVAVII